FRVDVNAEVQAFTSAASNGRQDLERRTFVVENANLQGLPLGEVPGLIETGVVVARLRRAVDATVLTATQDTTLEIGDVLAAIGSPAGLDRFQRVVGRATTENVPEVEGPVTEQNIVLTQKGLAGKTLRDLQTSVLHDVVATTVIRGDVVMIAAPDLQLRFGDVLQIVGPEPAMQRAAAELGNSVHALDETHFIPLFAGIGI